MPKRFIGNEQQLRTILNAIPSGLVVLDRQQHFIFCNDAGARLMGFESAEEVVKTKPEEIMSRYELYDEAGRPMPVSALPGRLALKGETEDQVLVRFVVKPSGVSHWSLVKARPILDSQGRTEYVISVFQEVTAMKEVEQRLREANNRVTKILESIVKEDPLVR